MAISLSFLNLIFLATAAVASPLAKRQSLASVYYSCTVPNTVALTFDDGPYLYNKNISDLLTSHGAKGTFFFNGYNWDCIYNADNIERVKYIYAAGHQIGSHTWSHGDLATFSADQTADGMFRIEEALSRIIGIKPNFMRPPYGSFNTVTQQVAASRGQNMVVWDQDTQDADGATVAFSESVYQTAVDNKVSNMIVLNHETEEGTAEQVIPFAINLLQSHGYKLVTLSECLGGIAPYLEIGTPQTQTADWTCENQPLPGKACDGTTIPCKTDQIHVDNPTTGGGGGGGNSGSGSNTPQSNIVIHPSTSSTKCLTAASNTNQAAVEISDCNGATNQLWSVTSSGLSIFGGAMCLDVTSGSATNGNKMQIYACDSTNANQKWSVTGEVIQWTAHSSCLDNTGGSLTNGNVVQIWTCTSGPNQEWVIGQPSSSGGGNGGSTGTNTPQANIVIHPEPSSTKCLTAASNTNQAAVEISDCTGATNQLWSVTSSGLTIFGGAMCLDVTSGSSADGNKMQIYACDSTNANQKWSVSGQTIQWAAHSSCLDNTGGSLTNGNVVQIWTCTAGVNQEWIIGQPGSSSGGGTTPPVSGKVIHPGSSSSTCLTVSSNADQAPVTTAPCVSGSASQAWTLTGGTLQIYGNKCLDVTSGSTANGNKLQVYTCSAGNTNQQFVVTSDNRITWTNHGECMDLTNGSIASGNVIQMWACSTGNNNQVWNVV